MIEYFSVSDEVRAKIAQKIMSELQQVNGIIFAYVYGSFNDPKASFRDVDIALYLETEAIANGTATQIATQLSVELTNVTSYPVDVQVINDAPLGFKLSVLKNGTPLFSRDDAVLEQIIEQVSIEYMSFHDIMLAESA